MCSFFFFFLPDWPTDPPSRVREGNGNRNVLWGWPKWLKKVNKWMIHRQKTTFSINSLLSPFQFYKKNGNKKEFIEKVVLCWWIIHLFIFLSFNSFFNKFFLFIENNNRGFTNTQDCNQLHSWHCTICWFI